MPRYEDWAAGLLEVAGWTTDDGEAPEGYDAAYYFADGRYLGPDEHGIEPKFVYPDGGK